MEDKIMSLVYKLLQTNLIDKKNLKIVFIIGRLSKRSSQP